MTLGAATAIVARLTRKRMFRSKTLWISGLLMLVPPLFALLGREHTRVWQQLLYVTMRMPIMLAVAVHLSAAIGEEIDDKTFTYLWSRPMPRGALVLGKLVAVVPLLCAGFCLTVTAAWVMLQGAAGPDAIMLARGVGGVAGVVLASAALAVGAGALFPKRPLVFVLIYLVLGEQILSFVPLLNQITIAFHGFGVADAAPRVIETNTLGGSIIGLAVLTSVWLGVALWRVNSAEYGSADG